MAHAGLPPEYAYGWGNDFDGQYAWYNGNSASRTHAVATTVPTSSPQNNADEIYDLAGNVWESVQDWYKHYLYRDTVDQNLWGWVQELTWGNFLIIDPQGPPSGLLRVVRGGGWNNYASDCRSARRDNALPNFGYSDFGFRLVRTPRSSSL